MTAPELVPIERLERLDDPTLARWRERLAACDYRPAVIAEAEAVLRLPVEAARAPLVRWALAQRTDPAARLARLWSYDDAVEAPALEAALGAELVAALLAAGVVDRDRDRYRSRLRLTPLDDLWILSDPPEGGRDAVMGPGTTTQVTTSLLPRSLSGEVLDVGTGAGSLALIAARRGGRATGVDLNPRAVAMAPINARLNGLAATFATGDLYAPVAGRRFEWIVAQPPYVIEPPGTPHVVYLHGGPDGTEVSARLLRALPDHLAARGRALIMLDAPIGRGGALHERYRGAIGDAAVDVVALAAPGHSAEIQAMAYASLEDATLGTAYAEAARRYRAHFATLGLTEFRFVALAVRREPGRSARDAFTATIPVSGFAPGESRTVDDLFEALDHASLPPEAFVRLAVSASPWARWVEERRQPGYDDDPSCQVRFERGGLGVNQELSAASAVLADLLGASADVETAIGRWAREVEEEPARVAPAVIEFVRRGLGTGLLVPRAEAAAPRAPHATGVAAASEGA